MGVVGQAAAKMGAEAVTVPTVFAGMEGRLPSAQEIWAEGKQGLGKWVEPETWETSKCL